MTFFSVLYQSDSYKEKGQVFIDPNKMSKDGTTAISSMSWTDDGELLAMSFANKGSDLTFCNVYFLKDELQLKLIFSFSTTKAKNLRTRLVTSNSLD